MFRSLNFARMSGVLAAVVAVLFLAAAPETATVKLVIDYGDGAQLHFTALPWRDGMTALDALAAAKAHKHGVDFTQRGSGSSAMVTKIGDTANEGGRGGGKNWIYHVNDKSPDIGAGVRQINAGDVVLWRFQVWEYNP